MRMLTEIVLQHDELEAIKLYDYDGIDQTEAAKRMNISQPTFARTLDSAHKKMAQAIVEGQAIKIHTSNQGL